MSEREASALLEQADEYLPHLHLERQDVVARGQQLVRRRRAGVAGMALATLALVAGLWWPGLGAGLLGTQQFAPASVAWEVDEPVTVQILHPVQRGDHVASLEVTKTLEGASGRFVVDGQESIVEPYLLPGGVEVYPHPEVTVLVFASPRAAERWWVMPQGPWPSQWGEIEADQRVSYWYADAAVEPDDVMFQRGDRVWTASGREADTAQVSAEWATRTAFAVPGTDYAGILGDGGPWLMDRGTTHGSGSTRPWWRGGESFEYFAVRLPPDATFARMVWVDDDDLIPGSQMETVQVADSSFALFTFDPDSQGIDRSRYAYSAQWSHDGRSWFDREVGAIPEDVDPVVGEGGQVRLLGEVYSVGIDERGWPTLEQDGERFLSVSDEDGVADGGVIYVRTTSWWPFSAKDQIHFRVGDQPVDSAVEGADGEPVVITGPAGRITVWAVPAG